MRYRATRQWLLKWIGCGVLSLASAAGAEPKTQTRTIDKVEVKEPKPSVKVTTETQGVQTRTVDGSRWQTTKEQTQSKTTREEWHGDWDENTWEGRAGLKNDTDIEVGTAVGNSTSKALGSTRLKEPEVVWKGEVGPSYESTAKGDLGQVTLKASAGAEGSILKGENGIEAKGQVGVEAEVKASTTTFKIGDKDAGASIKGSGRLEVSALAKGRFGAYVDDKGITFGVEGSAGVYAKGELKLSMEAHVFGVKTNVNLVASGYAGALAEGKAVVTLGWNGKVSFTASLGASLGFGGGVSVEFEMDVEELMKKLNLADMSQLLEWMKEFQRNPKPMLAKLGIEALRKLHEAGFGALKKLGSQAATVFEHQVLKPIQQAGTGVREGLQKGLAFIGRLVHSRRIEADMPAVNACLEQDPLQPASIPSAPMMQPSMEFGLCQYNGMADSFDPASCEGYDPYAWYPFSWPCSYNWPSL